MANDKWQMTNELSGLRVAIVHDWLVGGGAELVVEQLHELFPEAPIYTSYCSSDWRIRLDHKVKTGILQHWPFSKLRKFIPFLRIWWFRKLKLDDYDLVISSSGNGEAKHILPKNDKRQMLNGNYTPQGPLHISYIHAPTHFYWRHYDQYLSEPGFGIFNPLARLGLRLLVNPLRKWDYQAAQRPHRLLANSRHTQAEVNKFYNRKSTVVHPPVYLERFSPTKAKERKGFIIAGRQTPYKHFDIAVKACTKLNLPLTVIGTGPEHERLKKMAGRTITFLGRVTDRELEEDLAAAEAFIFPAYEDFGIAPVEALASGTPVIAYKAGGAMDYVTEGRTGLFFKHQTVESLITALERFPGHTFRPEVITKEAQKFSKKNFQKHIIDYLDQLRKR